MKVETGKWTDFVGSELARIQDILAPAVPRTSALQAGERRTTAILFLDLSNFTGLSRTLDHEVLHNLINTIMGTLSTLIEAHGGYVDKYEGDRIMALFGATESRGSDCESAVSCGRRMLDAITEMNSLLANKGLSIGARVGINFGQVTVAPDPSGHLTASGAEVSIASKIEDCAAPNCVLVSKTVMDQCSESFLWERWGYVEISGGEPVETYTPVGAGQSQLERWERSALAARTELVGRDRELSEIVHSGNNARGNVLILVRGEAGIGKSRLVHEYLSEDKKQVRVSCSAYAQPPMGVWRQMLDGLVEQHGSLDRFLEDITTTYGDSLPDISREILRDLMTGTFDTERDESAVRTEKLIALQWVVDRLSELGVILFIDDIHWIDQASLWILDNLLQRCKASKPLLVITTSRPEGPEIPSLFCFRTTCDLYQFDLEPLAGAAVRQLCISLLGSEPDELSADLEELLASRSGGNPYFLEELVAYLLETGALEVIDSNIRLTVDPDRIATPKSITGLLGSRIGTLNPDQRKYLQAAAVLGADFRARHIEYLARKLEEGWLDPGIGKSLLDRGFLVRTGPEQLSFRHELLSQVAEESLLRSNRAVLHLKAAEVLEEDESIPETEKAPGITEHLITAGENRRAIAWGLKALEHCRWTYEHEKALQWADRLLALLPEDHSPEEELELLYPKHQVYTLTGDRANQLQSLEEMEVLASSGASKSWIGMIRMLRGIYLRDHDTESAIEHLRESIGIFKELDDQENLGRALNNLGYAYRNANRLAEARETYTRALEISRKNNYRKGVADALGELGIISRKKGMFEEAIGYYAQAIELNREMKNRKSEAIIMNNLAALHLSRDELDEARPLLEQSLEIARQIGARKSIFFSLANLGCIDDLQQDYQKALERQEEALHLARETGDKHNEGLIQSNMADTCHHTGDYSRAESLFVTAISIFEEYGYTQFIPETNLKLSGTKARLGNKEQARELYLEACAMGNLNEGDLTEITRNLLKDGIISDEDAMTLPEDD